jgi:K+-transporting ATPase KdpF subunit
LIQIKIACRHQAAASTLQEIICSEHIDDGRRHDRHRLCLLRAVDWLRLRLRQALRRLAMTFDYSLAALVTVGLLIYLTYALLRPEQF